VVAKVLKVTGESLKNLEKHLGKEVAKQAGTFIVTEDDVWLSAVLLDSQVNLIFKAEMENQTVEYDGNTFVRASWAEQFMQSAKSIAELVRERVAEATK
jgi:hypothetical protein